MRDDWKTIYGKEVIRGNFETEKHVLALKKPRIHEV